LPLHVTNQKKVKIMAAAQPAYSDYVPIPCPKPKPRLRLVVSNPGKVSRQGKKRSSYGGRPIVISRARYYDPKAGRFITRDPIGFGGGINQYVYVGNNPVNYIDPNGTECQVDVYRTEALMSSGINAGHEWIVYGSQSVGFWPNRNWQVIRPDPAEAAGVPKVYHWGTSQLESGEIKWGSGAGKNCKCATCEDIHSCLAAVPNPGWRSLPIFNNCRRFVRSWALPGCCLNTN